MNQPKAKISPPGHSSNQPSSKELREEGEGDLPDLVRAPDPARGDVPPDAINASIGAPGSTEGWPETPPGASPERFTPTQAARARASHNERNGLGKPAQMTPNEQILAEFLEAERAYKEDYRGTRSERLQMPYLKAKEKMINAGLMKGDV